MYERDYYCQRILEMLNKIENLDILEYIYKMTVDIMKEDNSNEQDSI